MAGDAGGWIEELLVQAVGPGGPDPVAGSDVLHYSETLGRRVRSDATWSEAAISTYTKAQRGDRRSRNGAAPRSTSTSSWTRRP